MGKLDFSSAGRTEPLSFSIKRDGDPSERFISRNGSTLYFNEDSGNELPYTLEITDASGKKSVSTFPLTCIRPADCQEGPFIEDLLSFNPIGIAYKFHGVRVDRIKRSIIQGGFIVDQAIDIPTSSTVNTSFKTPLGAGTYQLRIEGDSCYSPNPSIREFIITDVEAPLAWYPGYPRFDYDSATETYRILLAINKAGNGLHFLIRNTDTNTVLIDGFTNFTPGGILDYIGAAPGNYHVEVDSLSADFEIDAAPAECPEGPTLLSVKANTATQTEFTFHGVGVQVIEWFIRTPSDVIEHTGIIEPSGSTVTINHPALSGGTHNLLIKGSSCTSEAGVVDNLDYSISIGTLDLTAVNVTQQTDGRYKLETIFSGGQGNYTINVRGLGNNVIATFPNTTGSPANVMLPAGTPPQTVKVSVIDANLAVDELTAVILPPPTAKLNFVQADNFISLPTKTPITADGQSFFIGASADFNWDVEFVLPNGGLWDYIEKRLRKLSAGTYVEKSISTATGQPQNYAVSASTGTERAFLPRTGQSLTIDSQNVFKTGNTWEVRFIARKGGANGTIVAQITRNLTVTAPPSESGIRLHNRSNSAIGSIIGTINTTGSSYVKPTPRYDISVASFDGLAFNNIDVYFKQKVGNDFVDRYKNSRGWETSRTSVTPEEFSLFYNANFGSLNAAVFEQQNQTWRVEFVASNGLGAVSTKTAIFNFTVNVASSFQNLGFSRTTAGGKTIQFTPGIDFGARPLSSGNMQLYHPANRPSLNGQSTTYPWIYHNHVRMHPDDLSAFRGGSGLSFPPGKHTITIKWHSAVVSNYDDVIDGGGAGNAYMLAGEQLNISGGHSGMDDYFTFTIVNSAVI